MVCTHLSELLAYEIPHYKQILTERKAYFDRITGEDVWDYLVERDFQKRFFQQWAEHEKIEFCLGCNANGDCEVREKNRDEKGA
tara:strand:- start:391 stop:642 length:252 start_codon:yes stop_codon:yes gene_type:complete